MLAVRPKAVSYTHLATILDFDLSYIIIAGTIVGLAAAVFSMFVGFRMLDRPGFWDPEKDENGLLDMDEAVVSRSIGI